MELVLLTAVGVGGATVIGALLGFIFKKIPSFPLGPMELYFGHCGRTRQYD